ncbi:MAG: hypothetical protein IPP77_06920 [Bacteroidetes bacterium]|nr:hypothetical protein [Bacteroidota bacterium]
MNECTECSRLDSTLVTLSDTTNNVIRTYDTTLVNTITNIHCTDDYTNPTREDYLAAIDYEVSIGATCASRSPTYTFNFCIDNSGKKAYPDYFDHGGRAPCVLK